MTVHLGWSEPEGYRGLWLSPDRRDRRGWQVHPAYLTPKANGINCYQNLHGAAWLGTLKLSQTLLDIFSRVWGSEDARQMALREYELYACLQFLARANSRRFDSYAEVRYLVADYVQAEYIARMWNLDPAKVMPLTMRQDLQGSVGRHGEQRPWSRKPTKTDEERRVLPAKVRPATRNQGSSRSASRWQERKAEEGQPS